jgi:hypothetical protein
MDFVERWRREGYRRVTSTGQVLNSEPLPRVAK